MRRRRLSVLLILLAGSLVALWYRTEIQVWARGADTPRRLFGVAAPELPPSAKTLHRRPFRLASLRGRVVLLHFWTYG